MVVIVPPLSATLRSRKFASSLMMTSPLKSTTAERGQKMHALVAGPPSPQNAATPVPAIIDTLYAGGGCANVVPLSASAHATTILVNDMAVDCC